MAGRSLGCSSSPECPTARAATTLPHVIESVVNMTVLRPALAYPFLVGLRFIPIPVVILILSSCFTTTGVLLTIYDSA